MIKLFIELVESAIFFFGDNPGRRLIKSDRDHYVAPEGRRKIHPHVAVFTEPPTVPRKSIFDQTKGDSDE